MYPRGNNRKAHTANKIAKPACIALAGGNGCKTHQRCQWDTPPGHFGHTRPTTSPREAVAESLVKIDRILLTNLVTLSFPRNSLKADAWSCTMAVMDSTEWQLSGWTASGCSASVMPVFSSYALKADSKRARKLVDSDWSPMWQVGKKCGLWKGNRFFGTKRLPDGGT